jgi:SAM-dependent methyltransferase
MPPTLDNRGVYADTVFDEWASREGLTDTEAILVDRFLDAGRSTLEAGTGAGRILLELRERGFGDLHGFDYVPGFIDVAKNRDRSGSVEFTVQDAAGLDYPDARFEQALYLQQVLCFIDHPADRFRAMQEARRVLRPGGTALFSFLCYEARMRRTLNAAFTRYLRVHRGLRHCDLSLQYQPWLQVRSRPNLGALADRGPYVYWYRFREALESLDRAGFGVVWTGSTTQALQDPGAYDARRLEPSVLDGMLYVACRRE